MLSSTSANAALSATIGETSFTFSAGGFNGFYFSYWVEVSEDREFTTVVQGGSNGVYGSTVTGTINGLRPGTHYYWRLQGLDVSGQGSSIPQTKETGSFTTGVGKAPDVTTLSPANNVSGTVTLRGKIRSSYNKWDVYFLHGSDPGLTDGTETPAVVVTTGTESVVSAELEGLPAGSPYYCRVIAASPAGTMQGQIVRFTPGKVPSAPEAVTQAVTALGAEAATLMVALNTNGADTAATIEYGTDPSLVGAQTSGSVFAAGDGPVQLKVTIPSVPGTFMGPATPVLGDLVPGAQYYYRVVATNEHGSTTGEIGSFTTPSISAPSIVETRMHRIDLAPPSAFCWVAPNGAATNYWFEYSESSDLSNAAVTTDVSPPVEGANIYVRFSAVTDLTPRTTYYLRAVAQNSHGITYGEIIRFTTTGTIAPGEVGHDRASIRAIYNEMGRPLPGLNFEYSTTPNFGTSTVINHPVGGGSPPDWENVTGIPALWEYQLTGLQPNTTYYYRYADGTAITARRGEVFSFVTGTAAPSLRNARQIGASGPRSADVSVEINPNGRETTLQYELARVPTFEDAETIPASSPSIAASESWVSRGQTFSGLLPDTTYWWRAVGTNADGVTRGVAAQFTTAKTIPLVTNFRAGDIGVTTAALRLEVHPNGLATSVEFFVAGASVGVVNAGSGDNYVTVEAPLTGLGENTPYIASAVATNASGSANVNGLPFRTISDPARNPDIQTLSPDSVSKTSAQLRATVNPKGIQTSVHFYINDALRGTVEAGAGSVSKTVTRVISDLSAGGIFSVRAVAVNNLGTFDGGSVEFNTATSAGFLPDLRVSPSFLGGTRVRLTVSTNNHGSPSTLELLLNGILKETLTLPGETILRPHTFTLDGLSNDTTYTVTAKATNSVGTAIRTVQFSTLGAAGNEPPTTLDQVIYLGKGPFGLLQPFFSDPNGDPVTVANWSQGAFGAVEYVSNKFVYFPGDNFNQRDEFTVTLVDDRGGASIVTVRVYDPVRAGAGTYDLPVIFLSDPQRPAGRLQLQVQKSGLFTGKAWIFGVEHPLRGNFNQEGHVTLELDRVGGPPYTAFLALREGAPDVIVLEVIIEAQEYADPYSAYGTVVANAASLEGVGGQSFTVQLPRPAAETGTPAGDGFLVGRVTKRGVVRMTGRTGDGQPFTLGGRLARSGGLGVGVTLGQSPRDYLIGFLNFAKDEATTVTGDLQWTSRRSERDYYPTSFTREIMPKGARFISPKRGQNVLSGDSFQLRLQGDVNNELLGDTVVRSTVTNSTESFSTTGAEVRIRRADGWFKGSARLPEKRKFQGVVIQGEKRGAGVLMLGGPVGGVEFGVE